MLKSLTKKLTLILRVDVAYFFHGSAWLMSGYIVASACTLISAYAFANWMPPELYGQYKYILSLSALLGVFSLTGIGPALVQATAKEVPNFFFFATRASLRFGVIIFLIASLGSVYYFLKGNYILSTGLLLVAFLKPLMDTSSLIFSYLNGAQLYKITSIATTIRTIVSTLIAVVSLLVTNNIIWFVTIFFSVQIFGNVLTRYFVKIKKEFEKDVKAEAKFYTYAKHTSVQGVINGIPGYLDKILVFQKLGAVELAIYTFATALPEQFKSITKVVDTLILPRFSKYSADAVRSNMLRKSFFYILFLSLSAAAYTFLAPVLFHIFFPVYTESVFLSQVYVWGIVFSVGSLPLSALKANLKNKALNFLSFSGAAVQLVSLLLLFYLFGLIGIVFARLIYLAYGCFASFLFFYWLISNKKINTE